MICFHTAIVFFHHDAGQYLSAENTSDIRLKPYFNRFGILAFSIGTSIGWGSFVVTCNTYLSQAGFAATIIGLIVGMAVIFVINHNLIYMMERNPNAGGIYAYGRKIKGNDVGFIIAWFLLLTYLAVLWANITSLPLFARKFLGPIFQFGFHYTVFGYDVYLGEVLLSIAAVSLVGLLVAKTRNIPQIMMIVMAVIFVGGLAAVTAGALAGHAQESFSLEPAFLTDTSGFNQIIHIASISPWAFIGFENVSHFTEELKFPVRKMRSAMIFSVILTTAVYVLMTILSVSAYPPEYASWFEYIQNMGSLSGIEAIPAFYAAYHYLGNSGVTILLVALLAVILTSIIGNLTALSRLLYAFGRNHSDNGENRSMTLLATLNRHHIPAKAIFFAVIISCVIPFLGRTAIGWIVDVTTLGAAIIYGFLSFCVWSDAKERGDGSEKVTGLLGTLFMILIALFLLAPKILGYDTMEPESYILFAAWALIGLALFRVVMTRDKTNRYGSSIVVWVILLLLMLLTTMMWVNRETQIVTEKSLRVTREYYAETTGSTEVFDEQTEAFLESQIDEVETVNVRNTLISFGMFIVAVFIMTGNYSTARKKEAQWRERAGAAQKISLVDSLTGVKNKYAFTQWEAEIDSEIRAGTCDPFAIVVCDLNGLKAVNDIQGHLAGDEYIRRGCREICRVFSHSPVFRYGGDEFVAILRGEDYDARDELFQQIRENSVLLASGMHEYKRGEHGSMTRVFEEADQKMYLNKKQIKEASM